MRGCEKEQKHNFNFYALPWAIVYAIFARSETESKTADVLRNVNSTENMAICWSLHFVSSHHFQRNTFYVTFGLEYRINFLRMNISA